MLPRSLASWFYPGAAIAFLLVHLGGIDLGGSSATGLACLAILIFGLPHGSLDLELIKRSRSGGDTRMPTLLTLYLGLVSATYLLWQAAPVLALAGFLLVAVSHFAEDWGSLDAPFLAQGMAVALLTAPTLGHLAALEALFVALSGAPEAAAIAQVMLLLAPVSLAVAAVAIARLHQLGLRRQAAAALTTLIAMALLPPVIGFALFFCVHHSPHHLRSAWRALADGAGRSRIVIGLTTAALAIAALLFALESRADPAGQAVAASFMTLSILTVPHMMVPALLAWLTARRASRTPLPPTTKGMRHANQGSPRIQP